MEKLIIGEVVKPQGIKGELKIKLYDNSKDLSSLEKIIIGDECFDISSIAVRQDFMFITIFGYGSIQEVEKFRMKKVYMELSDANELLAENEFFVERILEFDVVTSMNEKVGKLVDVQNYGSKDIAYINGDNGQVLLPIIEGLIKKIDEQEKKIIIDAKLYLEVACYED